MQTRTPAIDATPLDGRTHRLTLHGKLRGSVARDLQYRLEELAQEGVDRVLLDLRECTSLDSLGALALQTALDIGQRLYVVPHPGWCVEAILGRTSSRLISCPSPEVAKRLLHSNRNESMRLARVR